MIGRSIQTVGSTVARSMATAAGVMTRLPEMITALGPVAERTILAPAGVMDDRGHDLLAQVDGHLVKLVGGPPGQQLLIGRPALQLATGDAAG